MAEAPYRRSPLFHRPPIQGEAGALRLEELPFVGKFILRVDPAIAADPLQTSCGIELPVEPLSSANAGTAALLWLGPDEWMLVTAADDASARSASVRAALAGLHHQLVAVGDYYTIIEIAGSKAREALMKLTPLDLHPRAFRPGMVTGSVFGRANATIWLPRTDSAEEAFRLFIRWSMADYLWCLIADAGREWGVPQQVPLKGEALSVA
jgi:heterotetrameric sarcosine oxidase gamma subunit